MFDFLVISTRSTKRGVIDIYPKFIIGKSNDLMIRGGDFYAIWIEEKGLWSTDENDALQMIDHYVDIYAKENTGRFEGNTIRVLHMWDSESGMIDQWHKYCQKQMRDSYHTLDDKLIFSNMVTKKEDYASKILPYPLEDCPTPSYDKLMSTLYLPEEREKLEWAIGAIVAGDSVKIQKFLVLYGAAGTGKSTVLNIIQMLFEGYYSVFDAKALGQSSNSFALEAFRSNPLVAIQHDGDLSRIEDNTRLNSLVSHELMTVNEKFKSTYTSKFKCFLFVGTNKPVKITDAKSGLMRRLIDVSPSGNKLDPKDYKKAYGEVKFELGGIAIRCRDLYLANPGRYDNYVPTSMLSASNDFYNYVLEYYNIFVDEDEVTLSDAWGYYNDYVTNAKIQYPMGRRAFQEELKNYFREYQDRAYDKDGKRVRSFYKDFKKEIFMEEEEPKVKVENDILTFNQTVSLFDEEFKDAPAQYANSKGTPTKKWEQVTTKLSDLDTSKIHYVKVPENHIVIDFDIPDENGNKCYEKNFEAASKWPSTYAELSKSGQGIHLHYIYTGNVNGLSRVVEEHVEVKVFNGNSSLRRKLSKCNDIPIRTISSGIPLKKGEKMINTNTELNEKYLRNLVKKALSKEIHPNTKPNIDFIGMKLDEAYASGITYDLTDMRPAVISFAASSSNRANDCLKLVNKMKFKSEDREDNLEFDSNDPIVFYDVEVFPNLFLINWKEEGPHNPINQMINPEPRIVRDLMNRKLVGFNCRRYDNHILYARGVHGYSNEEIYKLSQNIVANGKGFFGEAYNVSYTDIYDFSSKKQSLKKFEIELGLHHQELGLKWDEPVPEELWHKVADYCNNDVIATESVFNARQADFTARKILADVAGMTVNDTTNSLTTRIIFGTDRKPQSEFNYRFMGDIPRNQHLYSFAEPGVHIDYDPDTYNVFTDDRRPWFPGYSFEGGKSIYRGEEVGEGGYVYAEPGIYTDVALLDIASMHPSSIIDECLFGPKYTKRFAEIKESRILIKHKDFKSAKKMLDGKLAKYLDDEEMAADLAGALKIAINSVYGLTSASFESPFRDIRNIDNIVAKRGALFMVNLKYEVQKRGFKVAHIKTDSIKIPNATPEIIDFVMAYGKEYGYDFEHEATYDRMCLVNNAVYIAKYKDGKHAGEWTATGTQFQIPYVFKTLFTKEPIKFEDLCETKSVTSALYLDMNESLPEGEHDYVFVGKVGSFCPIMPGSGGGLLLRENKDKFAAATGSKGYRWMESETVRTLGREDQIDMSYYNKLVDDAVAEISKYGDFEWFVSDDEN